MRLFLFSKNIFIFYIYRKNKMYSRHFYNGYFNSSTNYKFKTNEDLDIYKFRSTKSYMIKKLSKTEEEAYKIFKKREYNKILKIYNDEVKDYVLNVKNSFKKYYINRSDTIKDRKNKFESIENLINFFYKKLEKISDFVLGKRDTIPRFNTDLFNELIEFNSILSFSIGPQINSIGDIKNLNFYELAPSTMYILIYIIISKLYNFEIVSIGFCPQYIENKALICVLDRFNEEYKIIPILDFINEIYYTLDNSNISENDLKDTFKKIMFGNHKINTRENNNDSDKKYLPDKNIRYFCCNCLYDSNTLYYEYEYKNLFWVEN